MLPGRRILFGGGGCSLAGISLPLWGRSACQKSGLRATFLRYALGHWSLRSRPFPHERKLFLRKSTKIAAQGHRPVYRPDGARRFSIGRLPTANDCDWVLVFFDSLAFPLWGRWLSAARPDEVVHPELSYSTGALARFRGAGSMPFPSRDAAHPARKLTWL